MTAVNGHSSDTAGEDDFAQLGAVGSTFTVG
jgi:hypothetical protein